MTIPTLHETIGLAVQVGEPLLSSRTSTPRTYTNELDSYSHTRSAFMDYDKAKIGLVGNHPDAEDWLEYGLGRDVNVYDEGLDAMWRGFVNQIEIVVGNLTIRRGPLLGIGNRVSVVYAEEDGSFPPVVSDRTVTTIVQDADSQAKYGIIEKVVSAGQIRQVEAERLRDTYLEENKLPETSQGISTGGGKSGVTISVDCLGYGYWLEAYVYNYVADNNIVTIDVKMKSALSADPNTIISSDHDRVDYNGVLVSSYEIDDPYGLTVIKELVSYGGGSDERWLFTLDDERRPVYYQQPTDAEYLMSLGDGTLRDLTKGKIHPWAIRPGRWIFINDFLVGRSREDINLREDPRMVFIESVDYTAPYTYAIQGSKTSTVKQMLSKFGMKGLVS